MHISRCLAAYTIRNAIPLRVSPTTHTYTHTHTHTHTVSSPKSNGVVIQQLPPLTYSAIHEVSFKIRLHPGSLPLMTQTGSTTVSCCQDLKDSILTRVHVCLDKKNKSTTRGPIQTPTLNTHRHTRTHTFIQLQELPKCNKKPLIVFLRKLVIKQHVVQPSSRIQNNININIELGQAC